MYEFICISVTSTQKHRLKQLRFQNLLFSYFRTKHEALIWFMVYELEHSFDKNKIDQLHRILHIGSLSTHEDTYKLSYTHFLLYIQGQGEDDKIQYVLKVAHAK